MSDDDEVLPVTYASHLNMDEAFCACMFAAVELGLELESAPIGVVTTPGTKNPKYVPTEPLPLTSSLSDKDFV